MVDLYVQNEGTIFMLHPLSDEGRQWVREHIPAQATRLGEAVAVEHRYISDIVDGALADGLVVE